jgi:hypothetical protein
MHDGSKRRLLARTIAPVPSPFRPCGGGYTSSNRRMPPAVVWKGAAPRGDSRSQALPGTALTRGSASLAPRTTRPSSPAPRTVPSPALPRQEPRGPFVPGRSRGRSVRRPPRRGGSCPNGSSRRLWRRHGPIHRSTTASTAARWPGDILLPGSGDHGPAARALGPARRVEEERP